MVETMKRMYVEALFRNEDNECYVVHVKSACKYDLEQEVERLNAYNYKLVKCIITNNKVVSMKARLQFKIEELGSLDENTDYYGYDETLVRNIGLLTSRLVRRGVEIKDEVAIQCYNIRQKRMMEHSV